MNMSVRNYLLPISLKTNAPFPKISKTPGRLGPQGEEAVINVAYFKINCPMEVERHDKGSALFHIRAPYPSRLSRESLLALFLTLLLSNPVLPKVSSKNTEIGRKINSN